MPRRPFLKSTTAGDPIDLSLFSHIENDPFLAGTYHLEGTQFNRTIEYLARYCSSLDKTIPEVGAIQKSLLTLVKVEEKLSEIKKLGHPKRYASPGDKNPSEELERLSQDIAKSINRLQTNEEYSLPGGWVPGGGGSGHAMIYQFRKTSSGLELHIHNSGAGIENHERVSAKDRELYYPVLAYVIPEAVDQDQLAQYIHGLLKAQLPKLRHMKEQSFNEDKLYHEVISRITFLDAKPKPISHERKHAFTASQLSGTCAQRSLHQMLKEKFQSLEEYQRFIYGFKYYALNDYMKVLKDNPDELSDPGVQNLLKHAMDTLVRTLNIPGLFEDTFIADQLRKLQEYRKFLEQNKPAIEAIEVLSLHPGDRPVTEFKFETLPITLGTLNEDPTATTSTELPKERKLRGGTSLIQDLKDLIEDCRRLSDLNQPQVIIERLETMFNSLPIPETDDVFFHPIDFYSGIHAEDEPTFYQLISDLQQTYSAACQTVGNNVVVPKMIVVGLSAMAVVDYVAGKFPFDPSKGNAITPHITLRDTFLTSLFRLNKSNPFLASLDPSVDRRLKDLERLYLDNGSYTTSSLEKFYKGIIDSEPELSILLSTMYQPPSERALRDTIEKHSLQGLYAFTQNITSIRLMPKFRPLLDKYDLEKKRERCFYNSSQSFLTNFMEPPEITLKYQYSIVSIESVLSKLSAQKLNISLLQSKYPLEDDAPSKGALTMDFNHFESKVKPYCRDNAIQLYPPSLTWANDLSPSKISEALLRARHIDRKEVASREYFQLRGSSQNQIKLTLDYFKQHLSKLADASNQTYCEANIFQPGLLLDLLDEGPHDFLIQFEAFINDGLKHFSENGFSSQETLFFIRESYLVYSYIAKWNPELGLEKLRGLQTRLLSTLEVDKENTSQIKQTLHQYQFLTAMAIYKAQPEIMLNDDNLRCLISSYLFMNAHNNPSALFDMANHFDIECIKEEFKRILTQYEPERLEGLISLALEELALGECQSVKTQANGFYNVVMRSENTITPYRVDLQRGLVFNQEGLACLPIPLKILGHRVIPYLGVEHLEPCFCTSDKKIFELAGGTLRFIQAGEDGLFRVQKQWTVNGKSEWFELHDQSLAQKKAFGLDSETITLDLPLILKQRNTALWVSTEEPKTILLTEQNQPTYQCLTTPSDPTAWKIQELNQKGESTGYNVCGGETWIHHLLLQFESQDFVVICEKDHEYRVKLGRYGITLLAHLNPLGEVSIVIEDSPDLSLVGQMNALIPEASGLIFEDIHSKKRSCLMPLQPYRNTGEASQLTEFHRLKPDLLAEIPTKVVAKIAEQGQKELLPWQYSGTEHFIRYELGPDGLPLADTPSNALYLCYVYLCAHQPDKAHMVLEDCKNRLGGLKGTVDELSMLELIVRSLPYLLEDNDEDSRPNTPAYVACKLKALALYTSAYSPEKELQIPDQLFDTTTPDGIYKEVRFKQLKLFYSEFNRDLQQLYSRYQNMDRSLEYSFKLHDDEKKSLLDYYHFTIPTPPEGTSKALGALGFSWQMLGLKMLRKELVAINALQQTRQNLPEVYKKRCAEIQAALTDAARMVRGHETLSELELVPINLEIPETFEGVNIGQLNTDTIDIHMLSAKWREFNPRVWFVREDAMKALKMDTPDGELMLYFSDYFTLATSEESKDSENRKILIDFCRKVLMASHQTPLQKQSSKTAYFCNIILRLAKNPSLIYIPGPPNKFSYDDVFKKAERLPAPEIKIYQLKNTTSKILASASSLWEELGAEVLEPSPPMIASVSARLCDFSAEKLMVDADIGDEAYHLASQYRKQAHIFGRAPKKPLATNSVGLNVLTKAEALAGEEQYIALQEMMRIASVMFNNVSVRDKIQAQAKLFISDLNKEIDPLLHYALQLANKGPEDALKKRHRELEVEGRVQSPLDKAALLALYFKADRTEYILKTGLSAEDIENLHTTLSQYVALSVRSEALTRLDSQLDKASTTADDAQCAKIAQDLLNEDQVDYTNESALAFFQYHEKILLRPQQIDAIKRLLAAPQFDQYTFTGVVEKIIMGGGKSKVILPILAQKKATGSNLVVIEVPRALLETNFADLSKTSALLFGQKACLFEFNRDMDCTESQLEFLYHHLEDVIGHRDYLVTSGDAVQSLELKYLEVLLEKPLNDELKQTWCKRVEWLDKIVGLFKTRADVVMDEVHQALLLKKKLNYTLGDTRPVPKEIIAESVELYKFFAEVSLAELAEQLPALKDKTLFQVLENNQLVKDEREWRAIFENLSRQLVQNKQSPLLHVLQTISGELGAHWQGQLLEYFADQGTDIPDFILKAPIKVQNVIALYKEQLTKLLPQTLKRKLNEHYGPSRLGKEIGIAIPYVANNVPSERSRFGNYLEAINFSIQMLMKDGLPEALLKNYLRQLQSQARQELLKDASLIKIEETPTAQGFRTLLAPGFKLSALKLEDDESFNEIFQALRHNNNLICDILKAEVLPQIQIENKILHSDAYAHVDIYHSCQGITGTPWNSNTYHQSLTFNTQSSAASDGFILELLKHKHTSIRCVNYQSIDLFLEKLLAKQPGPDTAIVRAVIDISATFKGIKNIEVAKALALHTSQLSTPPLKYILFFNDNNVLCALDIHQATSSPIELGSTDPQVIDAKLGCSPGERFSYYDQSHTVGADLKQALTAKAMVLIDNETPLQSFLQGTMRMRGLQEDQSVEICVPQSLEGLSLDELIHHMVENEEQQLQQEIFTAAIGKMTNIIRADFMKRIQAIPSSDADKKNIYTLRCQAYFVNQASRNFFALFGALSSIKPTKEILLEHRNQLMGDWLKILSELPDENDHIDTTKMKRELNAIIEDAEPKCRQSYIYPANAVEGTEVELKFEKQVQIELQQEQQLEREGYDLSREATKHDSHYWGPVFFNTFDKMYDLKKLRDICALGTADGVPDFGEIYADGNYFREYNEQTTFVGSFLKPVHALLFRKGADGRIQCMILSQREAEEISLYLKKEKCPGLWLTTTQHSVLSGEAPLGVHEDPFYQEIIEQVRFFNGEFGLLRESDVPLRWLSTNTEQKLTFFEEHLKLSRETDPNDVELLRKSLSGRLKAFRYIAEHPLDNFTAIDWLSEISEDLNPADIKEAQNLAAAFADAHQHIGEDSYVLDNLPKQFRMSRQAADYIGDYERHLKEYLLKYKTDDQSLKSIIIRYGNSLPILKAIIEIIEKPSNDILLLLLDQESLKKHVSLVHALLDSKDGSFDQDIILKSLSRNIESLSEDVIRLLFSTNQSNGQLFEETYLCNEPWQEVSATCLSKLILVSPDKILGSDKFKENQDRILERLAYPIEPRLAELLLHHPLLQLTSNQCTSLLDRMETSARNTLIPRIIEWRGEEPVLLAYLFEHPSVEALTTLLEQQGPLSTAVLYQMLSQITDESIATAIMPKIAGAISADAGILAEIIKRSPKITDELLAAMLANDIFKNDMKLPLQLAEKIRQAPDLSRGMIQMMIPVVTQPQIKQKLEKIVLLKKTPKGKPSAAAEEVSQQPTHTLMQWFSIRHKHPDESKPKHNPDINPSAIKHKHGFFHGITKRLLGRKKDLDDDHHSENDPKL
jgi:hypothetical protein